MTPEQKQLEQIRERRAAGDESAYSYDDIDFLLSLVKSQEAENGYWPTLLDRGDGVRDHFCIGRLIKPGEIYWEFWNKGRWVSAGEVFVGRETAQKQLDAIRANDATSMRSACVEKLRDRANRYQALANDSLPNDQTAARTAAAAALNSAASELESLSIEKQSRSL